MVLLAEIARRGRDDGALGHDKFATCLNRAPHVVLADKLERRGRLAREASRQAFRGTVSSRAPSWGFIARVPCLRSASPI